MQVMPMGQFNFPLSASDKAQVEERFERAKQKAREVFCINNGLVAHILEMYNGSVVFVVGMRYDIGEKNKASWAMRQLAQRTKSCLVIQVIEAWTSRHATKEEAYAAREKYRSVEHTPGRDEAVMVMAEHSTFGRKTAVAIIHRNGDEVTLGEWKDRNWSHAEGRFVGMTRHCTHIPEKK